ncbi:Hint domain-containing protein [uncultured Jannaschia sp.]|uniref:Hint domain-containing protein n=1 Tax=uncultured Jannaschia sp. TaxID=293347 RepID=UPI00263873B3|nr:Hint domain-containing protein [uncultured Jannaschia sp.]
MNALRGNPLSTSATAGASGRFSVDADAEPVLIQIDDDDNEFDDGFIDPGTPQTLAVPVTVNGTTFPAGSVVELEFAIIADPRGGGTGPDQVFYYVRIDGVNVGMTGTNLPQPGISYDIDASSDGQEVAYASIPCFANGTLIETKAGARPVETLAVGDMIRTMDHGWQPIRWIGCRRLADRDLAARPDLKPVRIAPGVLGNDRALRVSPQHRICVSGWRSELWFGEPTVFVPAKALMACDGVHRDEAPGGVTYYHLLFDRHEVIYSEGCATESFHPGDIALDAVGQGQRAELEAIFGAATLDAFASRRTAYPTVSVREARAVYTAH